MSKAPSPQPSSGYASPASTASSSSKPSSSKFNPKPTNVFSNDGLFLERFQRTKKEEEEKKREVEALERKKNFDNRFRNRGKRPPPDSTPSSVTTNTEEHPAKKVKSSDQPTTEYGKQLKSFDGRSLKDLGTGVRPLVK